MRFNAFLIALLVVGLPVGIFGPRMLDATLGPRAYDPAAGVWMAAVLGVAFAAAVGALVLRALCDLEDANKGAKS